MNLSFGVFWLAAVICSKRSREALLKHLLRSSRFFVHDLVVVRLLSDRGHCSRRVVIVGLLCFCQFIVAPCSCDVATVVALFFLL
jgi:hypothetical protein